MECTLIPARARRRATFASSPGRSISSRSKMSFNSNFRPARESAFSVVCTSDVTTRRNELSCFDSLAIARMFTAAPARASVTRASSPVLSATKTLNSFMPCPLKTCSSESARRLQKTCFRGPSRHEPGAIPREQDRLPDVRQVEELLDEPVHAEAPTPVGRHAVPERLEIEIEVLDGQALLLHPPDQDVVSVLPLPPGSHLVALEFEVEGATGVRIFGIGHHVERLDRGRIAGEEVDLMAFFREALPEELLRLRVDVVSVPEPFALAPQDLECLLVPDAFEGEFRADR